MTNCYAYTYIHTNMHTFIQNTNRELFVGGIKGKFATWAKVQMPVSKIALKGQRMMNETIQLVRICSG